MRRSIFIISLISISSICFGQRRFANVPLSSSGPQTWDILQSSDIPLNFFRFGTANSATATTTLNLNTTGNISFGETSTPAHVHSYLRFVHGGTDKKSAYLQSGSNNTALKRAQIRTFGNYTDDYASALIRLFTASGSTGLFMQTNQLGITVADSLSAVGFGYKADYSSNGISNFGDRWIPDLGAVKDLIPTVRDQFYESPAFVANSYTVNVSSSLPLMPSPSVILYKIVGRGQETLGAGAFTFEISVTVNNDISGNLSIIGAPSYRTVSTGTTTPTVSISSNAITLSVTTGLTSPTNVFRVIQEL